MQVSKTTFNVVSRDPEQLNDIRWKLGSVNYTRSSTKLDSSCLVFRIESSIKFATWSMARSLSCELLFLVPSNTRSRPRTVCKSALVTCSFSSLGQEILHTWAISIYICWRTWKRKLSWRFLDQQLLFLISYNLFEEPDPRVLPPRVRCINCFYP